MKIKRQISCSKQNYSILGYVSNQMGIKTGNNQMHKITKKEKSFYRSGNRETFLFFPPPLCFITAAYLSNLISTKKNYIQEILYISIQGFQENPILLEIACVHSYYLNGEAVNSQNVG